MVFKGRDSVRTKIVIDNKFIEQIRLTIYEIRYLMKESRSLTTN